MKLIPSITKKTLVSISLGCHDRRHMNAHLVLRIRWRGLPATWLFQSPPTIIWDQWVCQQTRAFTVRSGVAPQTALPCATLSMHAGNASAGSTTVQFIDFLFLTIVLPPLASHVDAA